MTFLGVKYLGTGRALWDATAACARAAERGRTVTHAAQERRVSTQTKKPSVSVRRGVISKPSSEDITAWRNM